MAEAIKEKQEKHICGEKMITLVLADRPENLTYCPKCVSKEKLKALLANNK